jgi:hypothetical protein
VKLPRFPWNLPKCDCKIQIFMLIVSLTFELYWTRFQKSFCNLFPKKLWTFLVFSFCILLHWNSYCSSTIHITLIDYASIITGNLFLSIQFSLNLLTFRMPNLMFLFHCLGHCQECIQAWSPV